MYLWGPLTEPLQTLLSAPPESRAFRGQLLAGMSPSEGAGAARNALERVAHFDLVSFV
jgi:hypothetical protein